MLISPVQSRQGFWANQGPSAAFIHPNGSAIAFAENGGRAIAVAPPKEKLVYIEKKRSLRWKCCMLVVILIVLSTIAGGVAYYFINRSSSNGYAN